ncbi:glycosyltransferase [Pedobacter glucosidilyticus]|uniref:glycosyltransferase n=1 Tax=Pedobacter glucosidilyticus TaxID=1122941 RepID=UPI00040303C6|nr:glycosyltransferase family 2 protein [Pedobacter glucosidilyticus]
MAIFSNISLLITHYNRTASLERLLNSFVDIDISFGEIVVSDDGSKPENLKRLTDLQTKFDFKLVSTPINKGLGNNINKGQKAVSKPLTLYVQEDFIPCGDFLNYLTQAEEIMIAKPELDIIRFYAYFKYPYLKPYKNGFSEMIFKLWYPGYKKFYMYSDHPHLRRSNFLEKFGYYTEGVKGDVTEYNMMMSFLKNRGKGMFHQHYRTIFNQENSSAEPSTMKRDFWRESNNPLIKLMRHGYRHLKFNIDYLK